jgi:hypothetical protein
LRKIAALLAFAIVFGGVAYATIPDSGGVIHGCYHTNGTHDVVVVDSPSQSCPNGYTALNWSQIGPEGPTGPQGPTGPTGAAGEQRYYNLSNSQFTLDPESGSSVSTEIDCDTGDQAVNPAWYISGTLDAKSFISISSVGTGTILGTGNTRGMEFLFERTSTVSDTATIVVTGTCADLAPYRT